MDYPETANFLCDLEGTEVTLDPPNLPCQTWVIDKKFSERSDPMTQEEVNDGLGAPFTAGKFLCYRKEDPSKKAFMRIYLQIPITGTQYRSPQIRRQQAVEAQLHSELTILAALKQSGCEVVPELLAYQNSKQGEDGIVPAGGGGYVTYVVWDKVPGEPLSSEEFWKLDFESRQAIRDKFRETFPKLQKHGYLPVMTTLSKIIYDKSTGDMHFSGFGGGGRIKASEEWNDKNYAIFRLAKPPQTMNWADDPSKWTW